MSPETFDYVIVGAGSAGAVVASRLSEQSAVHVLLLEAGPVNRALEISMPAGFTNLFRTTWDWDYHTTAQPGLGGRSAYWPRMKALGGCSSMNAMMYIRGAAADFDGWERHFGAAGWGYRDVLPYFIRAEANSGLGGPLHGTAGPLHVEDRRYTHRLSTAWIDAAQESGLTPNPDFNGVTQSGVGPYQVTCRRGRRWSTAEAYLGAEVLARPNLTVHTAAHACRIVVENGRATGVWYLRDGHLQLATATSEIVLSGGAINSPQLLMLSGIGPAEHLRDVGIDVVVDLPGVGANLHDHPVTPLLWRTRGTTDIAVDHVRPPNLLRWQFLGRGPLVSNIGEAGGFVTTRSGLQGPDIQFIVAPTGLYDNGLQEPAGRMFTTGVTLVDVASRGTLRLAGADPRWRPRLDPAYFAEHIDVQTMLAGCRQAIDIVRTGPLARLIDRPFLHGSDDLDTAALTRVLRRWTQTLYHPVGTCAMGSGDKAVVDADLRVRGVDGLRVADASVMPRVTRGNTNAPTVMIGEKAADLLRGTHPPVDSRAATAKKAATTMQAVL